MIIHLEKQQKLQEVIKMIMDAEAQKVELLVPEYALITKNSLNFKILKETASEAGKKLIIVTTDKQATKLAEDAQIKVSTHSDKILLQDNSDQDDAAKETEVSPVEESDETISQDTQTEPVDESITEAEEVVKETEDENPGDEPEFKINNPGSITPVAASSEKHSSSKSKKIDGESEVTEEETDHNATIDPEVLPIVTSKPKKHKSLGKIALIFVGCSLLFVSGLAGLVFFVLPKATVELMLSGKSVNADEAVTIDVGAISLNQDQKIIPGTVSKVEESGDKTSDTTGTKQIGDKAHGQITIQNFTDQQILFPAGTVFNSTSGSASLRFASTSGTTVPAGNSSIENGRKITTPGESVVPVQASAIGDDYNLAAQTTFSVGTQSATDFQGFNAAAFSGGSTQDVAIVAAADQENLLTQLQQELEQKAVKDLKSKLVGDQKLIDQTVKTTVLTKTYDHQVAEEAGKVTLTLKIETTAVFYSDSQLKELMFDLMKQKNATDYLLQAKDITLSPEVIDTKDNSNVTLRVRANAVTYPTIDTAKMQKDLKGLRPSEAQSYLKGLDKVVGYNISLWPPLPSPLRRLPYLESRIEIKTMIQGK